MIEKSWFGFRGIFLSFSFTFLKNCRLFLSTHLSVGTFSPLANMLYSDRLTFFTLKHYPAKSCNKWLYLEVLIVGLLKNLSVRSQGFEITTEIRQLTSCSQAWGKKMHAQKEELYLVMRAAE